ncbi:MAG: bifunctional metallophosphatase/5'-nucleotidase [Azoarcus sp.]|nr:bifunctional metallophosphatase/5'-nucleotidase [Azoarcus sp.]
MRLSALLAALSLLASTAAFADCPGTLTFGSASSSRSAQVADQLLDGLCLSARLAEATGPEPTPEERFIAVASLASRWADEGVLTRKEAAALLSAVRDATIANTVKMRILAFNDFHGYLDGSRLMVNSPIDGIHTVPAGGIAQLAGLVRELRAGMPDTVVVSAGDLIGASPLMSAFFHDEPTIEAMNLLGLDFSAVGNHEFDDGRAELLRMQRGGCHPDGTHTCKGASVGTPVPFSGALFDFLAANVRDERGDTLFPPYGIRRVGNIRVAFIGVTLRGTPRLVSPAGVAGLRFDDEAGTINTVSADLRRSGVQAIVVLLHEGGRTEGSINDCTGIEGPVVDIVGQLDDAVDLVVSGHTHHAYVCRLPNRAGRPVMVTSAGSAGRLLTRIDLTLDRSSRDIVAADARNLVVERDNTQNPIAPDASTATLLAAYTALAEPIAQRPVGQLAATLERRPNAAGESALGSVIADAHWQATRAPQAGGTLAAFTNPGGMRGDLVPAADGSVTYADLFRIQPFGNTLTITTLSGAQLYEALAQQWRSDRVLQVSSSISYRYREVPEQQGAASRQVCPGSLQIGGRPVAPDTAYRIAVNSYLAAGGDGFDVFTRGRDALGGALDVDALAAYLERSGKLSAPAQNRIHKVEHCD